MIKVTYNRNHPLACRFISHTEDAETHELLQRSNASRDSRRTYSQEQPQPFRGQNRKKSEISEHGFPPQQTKIVSEIGVPHFGGRMDMPLESRFQEAENNHRRMKQSETIISKTRKDSLADIDTALLEYVSEENCNLHNLRQAYLRLWFEKMALENHRLSQPTDNRREEGNVGLGRRQDSTGLFYNPQAAQNKTAFLPSHSNSMQGHPLNNHWGSIHPRNFNVTTTRSNM